MEQLSSIRHTATHGLPRVRASKAVARQGGLYLITNEGKYLIPWVECSPTLAIAKQYERMRLELLPAGIGIHWPLIDEDLAVGPLVAGRTPLA